MSWYENARALSHSEVYPSETAALEDQQRATAHSWKVQQRTVAESDADNAPQRINRLAMYPMLAAARALAEVQVTYSRTDHWLRAHRPDQPGKQEETGVSQYGREAAS
jgi:hypothetical protein